MEITQRKLYFYQQVNGWRFNLNNGTLATKDFSIAHWYYIIAFKCHVSGKERTIFWMLKRELDRSCSDGGLGPSHDKQCHWHSWPLALCPQQQELQPWDEFAMQPLFSANGWHKTVLVHLNIPSVGYCTDWTFSLVGSYFLRN